MHVEVTDPKAEMRAAGRKAMQEAVKAKRDFMRAIATDLPRPQSFVQYLDAETFEALTHCTFVRQTGWRLPQGTTEAVRKRLERLSVTQLDGWFLTLWGARVREAACEAML